MTNDLIITTRSRFDAAILNHQAARAAAAAVEPLNACDTRNRVFNVLAEATDALLNTPALTLGDVAKKLEAHWDDALFIADDPSAEWRQMIIGDLRRIERLRAGLEEPDASGGMNLEAVASDWARAQQEYSLWQRRFEEGTSVTLGERQRDETAVLRDDAEGKLLSKHAPHMDAVLEKLMLLLSDAAIHRLILRDLRRLG